MDIRRLIEALEIAESLGVDTVLCKEPGKSGEASVYKDFCVSGDRSSYQGNYPFIAITVKE